MRHSLTKIIFIILYIKKDSPNNLAIGNYKNKLRHNNYSSIRI